LYKFNLKTKSTMTNKHIPFVILIGLSFVFFEETYAQQEPVYAFYGQQLNIINPSVAGSAQSGLLTLIHKRQWNGVAESPESTAFSYGSEWGKRLGGGISLWSDRTFVEQQTMVTLDFSYEVPLSQNHSLYMGLKAGGNFYKVNLQGLETFNKVIDPSLVDIARFLPNFGIGFYLEHDRYYIALSAPRILSTKRSKQEDGVYVEAADRPHYYVGAGLVFPLGESFSLQPSVLFRKVGGAPLMGELTSLLSFNNRFSFGAGYRTSGTVTGLALFGITEGFELGYAYDAAADRNFGALAGASHEVLLRIRLGSKIVLEEEVEEILQEEKNDK
jgi:type IX secretion system PorP/SprF family membrane protein